MQVEDYLWDCRNPYEWMQRVRASRLLPLTICCAISGGVQGKEANPNLPETPEEQAAVDVKVNRMVTVGTFGRSTG